jgi:hypothetical protein
MKTLALYKEFPYLNIYYSDNNIIYIKIKEGQKLELQQTEELLSNVEPLGIKGYKYLLTNATVNHFDTCKASLDAIALHSNWRKYFLKHAIVTKHSTLRLLAGFYVKFSNPSISTKIFDNEENAIKWLKSK